MRCVSGVVVIGCAAATLGCDDVEGSSGSDAAVADAAADPQDAAPGGSDEAGSRDAGRRPTPDAGQAPPPDAAIELVPDIGVRAAPSRRWLVQGPWVLRVPGWPVDSLALRVEAHRDPSGRAWVDALEVTGEGALSFRHPAPIVGTGFRIEAEAGALFDRVEIVADVGSPHFMCGTLRYEGLRIPEWGSVVPPDGSSEFAAVYAPASDGFRAERCADATCVGPDAARTCGPVCGVDGRCAEDAYCADGRCVASDGCRAGYEAEACGGPASCEIVAAHAARCLPPGAVAAGGTCSVGGGVESRCAPGGTCHLGRCRLGCSPSEPDECSGVCVGTSGGTPVLPFAVCVDDCDPMTGAGCSPADECLVGHASAGATPIGVCVPRAERPNEPGAACDPAAGARACAAGLACGKSHDDGRCLALCDPAAPECAPGVCATYVSTALPAPVPVCFGDCDLMGATCAEGEACLNVWGAEGDDGRARFVGSCGAPEGRPGEGERCARGRCGADLACVHRCWGAGLCPGAGTGDPGTCRRACRVGAGACPDGTACAQSPVWPEGLGICEAVR
jgi:hypothetical protein